MKKTAYTPLKKLYQLALEAAGDQKKAFKRSLKYFVLAYFCQGLVFSMFYPLLNSLFNEEPILLWIGIMTLATVIYIFAKWKGHDFDFSGHIIDVTHDLRTRLGESLRCMPLEVIGTFKTGELNAIFSSSVEESVITMGTLASMIVELVVVPMTMVIVTAFIDWRLALIMAVMFPVAIPLYHTIRRTNLKEKTTFSQESAELEAGFVEYIQGLSVLRAVNRTGTKEKKLQSQIKAVHRSQLSGIYKVQFPFVMMGLLIEGILLIILFVGAYFVLEGSLAFLTLAACLIIVARLVEPMALFVGVISLFEMTDIALKRINGILTISPLIHEMPVEEPTGHHIQFDAVEFSYQGQRERTINGVSFEIPENTMTAIVGHSGCGKTTLTKLLMRYADVQKGCIRLGGADIRHMSQEMLMEKLSVVFQDVYLFDDTIINNVVMNNPKASKEQIDFALKSAHCYEFIQRLPNGYETMIGDIGGSLSGGERQRMSIARAILKDAPIVILDEPTAALDTESEVSVQQAIDELVENKTVVVIAHRLSTVVGADQILVMDQGQVVERGKHHELMALKGKYFQMWSAQQRIKNWRVE